MVAVAVTAALGVFARFLFGLETYNQILLSAGIGLVYLGLFLPTEFWEKQLSFVFNSDSSRCLNRWLAYAVVVGFAVLLGVGFHVAERNLKHLERLKGLRYVTSACRHECLYHNRHRRYLSDSSLLSMAWFAWVPMLFVYFALTNSVKYSNNQLNLIKYTAQFRNRRRMALKLALYLLVNVPIIISAWVRLGPFWADFCFKLAMALLWVLLYRVGFPLVKKRLEYFVNSDMFAPWMLDNDDEKTGLI